MNCREIESRLSAYQDGALDASTAERIRRHLESCRECREELHALEALAARAKEQLCVVEAPEGFARKVMAGLPERSPVRRGFLRPVFGWAAAAVAILLGLLILRYDMQSHLPPTNRPAQTPDVAREVPPRNVPLATDIARSEGSGMVDPRKAARADSGKRMVRKPPAPPIEHKRPVRMVKTVKPTPPAPRHEDTAAPDVRTFRVAERKPLVGVELARVQIGNDRATPNLNARRTAEKRSVKLVTRPNDQGLSVGVTIE